MPELVQRSAIVVVVDTPSVGSRYGGIVAAPAFAEIGTFTMRYLGIEPDAPTVIDEAATAARAAATGTVLDAHGHPEPVVPVRVPGVLVDPEDALLARTTAVQPELQLVADAEGHWILPDLHGRSLRDALAGLAPAGLELQVAGFGRVAEQAPAPGTPMSPGDSVRLRFN